MEYPPFLSIGEVPSLRDNGCRKTNYVNNNKRFVTIWAELAAGRLCGRSFPAAKRARSLASYRAGRLGSKYFWHPVLEGGAGPREQQMIIAACRFIQMTRNPR
jgi:hypothetical protein